MKVAPGSLFALETIGGIAYLQYSNQIGKSFDLVRVLPGLFSRVPDLNSLCAGPTLRWIMFPIRSFVRSKDLVFVNTFKLPPHIPTLMLNSPMGDGQYMVQPVGGTHDIGRFEQISLTDEQIKSIPQMSGPNLSFLRQELPRLNGSDVSIVKEDNERARVSHFLYFPSADLAKSAQNFIEAKCKVEFQTSAIDGSEKLGLVVIDHELPLDEVRCAEILAQSCSLFGGEYDGFEVIGD